MRISINTAVSIADKFHLDIAFYLPIFKAIRLFEKKGLCAKNSLKQTTDLVSGNNETM